MPMLRDGSAHKKKYKKYLTPQFVSSLPVLLVTFYTYFTVFTVPVMGVGGVGFWTVGNCFPP